MYKEIGLKLLGGGLLSFIAIGDAVGGAVPSMQNVSDSGFDLLAVASELTVNVLLIFAVVWLKNQLKEKEEKIDSLNEKLLKAYAEKSLQQV